MTVLKRSILSLLAITALSTTTVAHAHISMKGALQSRGGDQKMSPCDGKRGDGMVYTFAPGATITLAVNEDIPHPSYFRIAFDDDGEDFVEPASIDPIDPNRACPVDKDDQCGKSDFCTTAGSAKGAVVLWDNLDPHLSDAAKGGTWNIKLPDVECDNCTLQVLQIMEDDAYHGAYCPQGTCAASANSLEDIYHRCIDIKLVKGAASGPGVTTDAISNMGMECPAADASGGQAGSAGSAAGSGGSSGASATAGAAASAGAGGATASTTPATGGAGGSAAPSKPATTTPSSGSAGTGTQSNGAMTSSGSAGKPAATSGSAGSSSTDTPEEAPKADDGGCAVSQPGSRSNLASAALVSLMAMLFLARRRRQRA